jgi:hypothetical protein
LYQQLAEIEEQKQLEYDENTKKIFAPPKALDEDDVRFFQHLESQKAKAMEARAVRDNTELKKFREAANRKVVTEQSSVVSKVKLMSHQPKSQNPLINSSSIIKGACNF